ADLASYEILDAHAVAASLRHTAVARRCHGRYGVKGSPLASSGRPKISVRSTPDSRHDHRRPEHLRSVPQAALSWRSKVRVRRPYSITSSARARSVGGIVRPSTLAVLELMTSWNLLGCSTANSAGFAPLRIRSTYPAACL